MSDDEHTNEDDLALSALLDNALPSDEASRLRRRIAAEPALSRRLDELRRADDAVRLAYDDIAAEPLPESVTRLLQTPLDAAIGHPPAAPARWFGVPTAVSAGLALVAGFALAFVLLPKGVPAGPGALFARGGAVPGSSTLYQALQATPSGQTHALGQGWTATPRLTFVSIEGLPCRSLELTRSGGAAAALACRRDGVWQLELVDFAAPAASGTTGRFTPAAGGSTSRVDDAIDALIDDAPLGRDAERKWIARGWERD